MKEFSYAEVKDLVNSRASESDRLDFKEFGRPDSVSLIKDIAAFANSEGGTVLVGVKDAKENNMTFGLADEEKPVGKNEILKFINGVEAMIQTSISPALPPKTIQFHQIQKSEDAYFLAIEVRQSPVKPVRAGSDGQHAYPVRRDKMSVPLTYSETRELFLRDHDQFRSFERWIDQRIQSSVSGYHLCWIVPLYNFVNRVRFSNSDLLGNGNERNSPMLLGIPTANGIKIPLVVRGDSQPHQNYKMALRSGGVELSRYFFNEPIRSSDTDKGRVNYQNIRENIGDCYEFSKQQSSYLQCEGPIVVCQAWDFRTYEISSSHRSARQEDYGLFRGELNLVDDGPDKYVQARDILIRELDDAIGRW
jgi:hypothetical protein